MHMKRVRARKVRHVWHILFSEGVRSTGMAWHANVVSLLGCCVYLQNLHLKDLFLGLSELVGHLEVL